MADSDRKNSQEITDVKKDLFVKYKDKVLRLVLPEDQIVTWRDVSEVIRSAFGFSNLKFNYIIEDNQTACIHNQETFEQAVYEYKITNFELDCDLVDPPNISPCSYGEILIQESSYSSSSSDDATDSTVVNSEREDELLINPYTETASPSNVSSSSLIVLPETGESVNMFSNHLSSVPDYVNLNYLQNQLDSFRCRDYTVFYHDNGYERIADSEFPISLGMKSKKKKKEPSEKCVGNSEIDLIDFNKDKTKRKRKKEIVENVTLTPVQSKESELSVFVPVAGKECYKSPSYSKSDKNKKEPPVENEEREHYVYVPIFGKEYCKSPSCYKSDKNKKEKREKKHKSCTISKNHPFLACVKENCATKYEEWKKMLQKYVNPETSDKPPKWFLEFMKQYKQDIIHDVVHKTTRRIFKATEGFGGPLNCCRSKPNELKLTAITLDKENKTVADSTTGEVAPSDEKQNHGKVICDGCNNLIEGIWYRCCNCADYDLCEACENRTDIHDGNHVFLKIRKPLTNQGKQLLIKKSPLLDDILYDSVEPLLTGDGESKFQLCCYDCKFIKDETIPDGTILQPKMKFVKSWLVRNNGNVPWDSDVKLQFMWGTLPPRRCEIHVPPLKIGEEDLVSVELSAPEKPGHYESHWQLRRHRRRFGPRIWCSVEVEDPKPIENKVNVTAIPKPIYHVQILKTPPEEDIRPSNDQIEKESVYKSVSEFISQTTTPNNTPLEFSPPRSPDPSVDLLGGLVKSMANSTINEDKLENVAKHEESTEHGELQTLEQCPQEFFVDAEESLPLEVEAGICTPLSPDKLNNGSPVLTPTDSSMEVLSEDDDSENPEMQTALNTSALSLCSDNDYVMVPWPECFVLESSAEGENSKDEDVIICDGSPSDETLESDLSDYLPWSLAFPKHFATYDSRVSERNNNYVFIPEKLSSASPTNFINDGEEVYNKETPVHISSVSCKHEDVPSTSPEVQLLLNKCIQNKTKNHPGLSEFSKVNYEACEFKTSKPSECSPDSASVASLPMYTILMPNNKDQKSPITIQHTVNTQETRTSLPSSDFLPTSASHTSDKTTHEKSLPAASEPQRSVGLEFANTKMTHLRGHNFSSTSQKEIKEKVIILTAQPSSFSFQCPTSPDTSSVPCTQQIFNGNQSPVNDQILYSCDTRLESPTSPTDGSNSFQPAEVTRDSKTNDVQWNQILADQMMPHSASQVAANLMNTALTAGALALNTAKAVFNTLQAKQNESQECSEENADKDTVPKSEVVPPTPMEQLMEMGFCDRALNTQVLQQSNNDLGEAVAKLLELTDNNWHQRR